MKILKIRCQNFKSFVDKTIDFSDKVTWIKGMNADGKTTVASAYLWLFFNVDYDLANNPSVRRMVDGKPVDDVDVDVSATMEIDGVEVTFRKVQKRKYKKDSLEYSDDNSYFVNDVPKTLKEFNLRIGDDIKVMLMCSHINAFISKKPDELRNYLLSHVDGVSDAEIARKIDPDFATMLEKYSAEELKAMNNKVKTECNKQKPVIEGKIQEKERDVALAHEVDVAELELERNRLKRLIADTESKIEDVSKVFEEQGDIQAEIMKVKFDINGLQQKANQELDDKSRKIWQDLNSVDSQLKTQKSVEKGLHSDIERLTTENKDNEVEIKRLREEWKSENDISFNDDSLVCSYCGQPLPEDRQDQIKSEFSKKKKMRLDNLTQAGKALAEKIEKNNKQIENMQSEQATVEADIAYLSNQANELEESLKAMPKSVDITATDDYKALSKKLEELESKVVKDSSGDEVRKELKAELSKAQTELVEVEKKIAFANTADDEERLEELRNEYKEVEQKKTDAEKIIDLLAELDKAKNTAVSESINNLFKIVKWRLFDYNKSGTYINTCVPTINNLSILTTDTNKASRFIGKLDICNSIQKLEKINIPIFLDDVESLDSENTMKAIETVDCQVILLKVTDDKELIVE